MKNQSQRRLKKNLEIMNLIKPTHKFPMIKKKNGWKRNGIEKTKKELKNNFNHGGKNRTLPRIEKKKRKTYRVHIVLSNG